MSLVVRRYEQKDYSQIYGWWEEHKWSPIPPNCLPELGIMVEDVCCGFLYKTDSKIAWIEFIISNPKSDKELRDTGLNLMLEKLLEETKDFSIVFTSSNHSSLINRYQKHGFNVTDVNVTHLIKVIGA